MDNSFNPNIVNIFCRDCCSNGLQLLFEFEWDESPMVYLTFLCNAAKLHSGSIWKTLFYRLRMAWNILRGKSFCLHDIILDKSEWFKFYDKLTECNEKVRSFKR